MPSLLDELAGLAPARDAYDRLPESIRATYSRDEWLWLSDADKDALLGRETEPETYSD